MNPGAMVELKADVHNFSHSECLLKNYVAGARSIQFVMCCLFAGIIINFGSKKYHYPYTVGCFVFGVGVGLLDIYSDFIRGFTHVTRMDPSDMMLLFLPILIFESSFNMDAHMFYRTLLQCIILAIPGLIFCTTLTAVFAKYALQSYNWSWFMAFLFGSIISATDPVAVVSLLKEMRMPHSFTILIEGESLLNDGVAIVLFEKLSLQIITAGKMTFKDTILDFAKTCIGAPILGYLFAKISDLILVKIYINPVSEMTVTLIMAYVTYFVAERLLGVSAVLAVVLYGITLNANKMCISPESESLIYTYWRLLSVFANTLIFVICGILVSLNISEYYDHKDTYLVFSTYVSLVVIRFLMVALFYPILCWIGYGLTIKESVILSWGGLRGAVGLALALMIVFNPKIDKAENASKILVQVSGIIILTLLINANTVKLVMKLIRFKQLSLVSRLSMGNAITCVSEVREKSVQICKRDWKCRSADWTWLWQKTCVHDPYKGGLYGDEENMSSLYLPYGTCNECIDSILPYVPSHGEMKELNEAARKKILRAMKGNLWKQFHRGLVQRRTLKLLNIAIDNAFDTPFKYLKTKEVSSKFMKVRLLIHFLETKTAQWIKLLERCDSSFDFDKQHKTRNRKGFQFFCAWFYFSWWFEPITMIAIIVNILQIVADLYFVISDMHSVVHSSLHQSARKIIRLSCIVFVLFYILETIIKIIAVRWIIYIKYSWNQLDLLVNSIAIIEGFIDYIILTYFPQKHSISTHIRIIIVLRLMSICKVLRVCLIKILLLVRNYASTRLYYSYDIGRGFLFANEAVLKKIDTIIDFGPCAEMPVTICEDNIKEMITILMEFEAKHPAIAFALKSNRAARRILNRVNTVMHSCVERSIVNMNSLKQLNKILFNMTKSVVYAPKIRLKISDTPKVLETVDWIRDSNILQKIIESHVICSFKSGNIIQEMDDFHDCVYVIIKGIIKVSVDKTFDDHPHLYNLLPNTDTYVLFEKTTSEEIYDYLTTSQTIGLLGYLQRTKSTTTAVCEKDCQLIQIQYSLLKNIEKENEDLIFHMWKSVALNIAFIILKKQPRYIGCTEEVLEARLQKAIIPTMKSISHFDVPSVVDDMVLIQGRAKDFVTGTKFDAPTYIQNTFRSLIMLDDIRKRPPIIIVLLLEEKYDFPVCSHWIQVEDINSSGICSLHPMKKTISIPKAKKELSKQL